MASIPASVAAGAHRIEYADPVHVEMAWEQAGDVLVVTFAGELCTWSSEVLRAPLLELISTRNCQRVDMDLSDVSFIDARGLRLLLVARTRAAELGKTLAVTVPSPAVTRVLNLCGLDHAFDPSGSTVSSGN
jgi:anti-sigma B factor antagonist